MKKMSCFVLLASCLVCIGACKGDKTASNIEEWLLTKPEIAATVEVRVMGQVKCNSCKPEHSMTVEVWENTADSPDLLNNPPWIGDFDEGNFSVDVKAPAGTPLAIKAYVFSNIMKGPGIAEVTVPTDGENPILSGITIEIDQ